MVLKKISRAEEQLGLTELTVNSCFSALFLFLSISFIGFYSFLNIKNVQVCRKIILMGIFNYRL